MAEPLVPPESQYCDANGNPYAGGTITTYIPGTDTPKDTYSDLAGTVLNTNPIVLDAAGRALIYGVGDYRFVLRDATGNLIYDQLTSAIDTSAFVSAADLAAAVQAETDRAMAAENAETARAEAAENTLTTNLNAEIARAEAAEANLQSQITALSGGGTTTTTAVQVGLATTDATGHVRVTFPTAYSGTPAVVTQLFGASVPAVAVGTEVNTDTTGFDLYAGAGGTGGSLPFMWIAAIN